MLSQPKTRSDEELACETRAGSLDAFEELVSRYERRICSFLAQMCRNPSDARELTQDTFVKAFQSIALFDPRRSFAGWLFTIARRKCIDHQRGARPVPEETPPEAHDGRTPAEVVSAQEEAEALWALARGCLPENQLQALWLRYAEDMSIAEIAEVMRKTKTHVKVLLFRARVEMARQMNAPQNRPLSTSEHMKSQIRPAALERSGLAPM